MRFCDKVGYLIQEESETRPGVMIPKIQERMYYGDVLKNGKRNENTANLIDDIQLDNEFSIVADKFALEHFWAMQYIIFYGTKWRISSVDASTPPRIKIRVRGVYNGPEEDGGYGPQSKTS